MSSATSSTWHPHRKTQIKIKPFRQISSDAAYTNKTWELLENAIREIQNQNAGGLSFEQLYRNAYNMILHKHGEKLYKGVCDTVTMHLKCVATEVASRVSDNFLVYLNTAWLRHRTAMRCIRDILMYMDRTWVKEQDLPCVYHIGLDAFRTQVIRLPTVRDHLKKTMLDMIDSERAGDVVDRDSLSAATNMLLELGVNGRDFYVEEFEIPFLRATALHYAAKSRSTIAGCSSSEFLFLAQTWMNEEILRVERCLDSGTVKDLRLVMNEHIISAHKATIVSMEGSGLRFMLHHGHIGDLQRMYTLLLPIEGGVELIRAGLSEYLRGTGRDIVISVGNSYAAEVSVEGKEEEDTSGGNSGKAGTGNRGSSSSSRGNGGAIEAVMYIQRLLDLHAKFSNILSSSFKSDKVFLNEINASFEYIINLRSPELSSGSSDISSKLSRSAEFLSLYVDDRIRKSLNNIGEEETEVALDGAMMFFRYLEDKDYFERYYKSHLARRLLHSKDGTVGGLSGVHADVERSMITRLKTEQGYAYTTKLEGMFKDIAVSADTLEQFKEHISRNDMQLGIDLNVRVLSMGHWPSSTTSLCLFPAPLLLSLKTFETFYLCKHSGRKLAWQPNLSTAVLQGQFGKKTHELMCSAFQMAVLVLFKGNTGASISFENLREQTGMHEQELKRALVSLACGKTKVLLKSPPGRDVNADDVFSVNEKFTSPRYRVKIQTVVMREKESERDETMVKVANDRQHLVDACIVRIMKARKNMDHTQLVSEVTSQLHKHFVPNVAVIKKRIESLIDRDFLSRSEDNRRAYTYVA